MLFKAIDYGKEHRKHYSSKSSRRFKLWCLSDFDHSPKRNQDPWNRDDRLYNRNKGETKAYFDMLDEGFYIRTVIRIK